MYRRALSLMPRGALGLVAHTNLALCYAADPSGPKPQAALRKSRLFC